MITIRAKNFQIYAANIYQPVTRVSQDHLHSVIQSSVDRTEFPNPEEPTELDVILIRKGQSAIPTLGVSLITHQS